MCEHLKLKYYPMTDRVICLDCGEVFEKPEYEDDSAKAYTQPTTTTYPNPYYPNITYTTCG